jgi:hypothetical protein
VSSEGEPGGREVLFFVRGWLVSLKLLQFLICWFFDSDRHNGGSRRQEVIDGQLALKGPGVISCVAMMIFSHRAIMHIF